MKAPVIETPQGRKERLGAEESFKRYDQITKELSRVALEIDAETTFFTTDTVAGILFQVFGESKALAVAKRITELAKQY